MLPTCHTLQRPNDNERRKRDWKLQTNLKGGKETVKEDPESSCRRRYACSTNAIHTNIQAETFP
eukprot:3315314-Rhodomonas_salina.1